MVHIITGFVRCVLVSIDDLVTIFKEAATDTNFTRFLTVYFVEWLNISLKHAKYMNNVNFDLTL